MFNKGHQSSKKMTIKSVVFRGFQHVSTIPGVFQEWWGIHSFRPETGGQMSQCQCVTWPQVDVPGNSKASELKDFMARELQVSPYTFKLQLDLGV